MSEVIYIKCDGPGGCENTVLPGSEEAAAWEKDDMDADFCPTCQKRASDLANSAATATDLETFGALVSQEADKAEAEAERLGLEKNVEPGVPLEGPMLSAQEFDEALETVVKDLVRELKKQKKSKKFIAETVTHLREQAAAMRKERVT